MPAQRNRKPRSVWRPPIERKPIERPHPVAAFDAGCVQRLNRLLDHRPCLIAARAISRLGDGEAWLLLIALLAVLTALVRVMLGLHYSSDVLAGAVLGAALALTSLWLLPG
jgi:hypothetical protein